MAIPLLGKHFFDFYYLITSRRNHRGDNSYFPIYICIRLKTASTVLHY